MVVAPPGRLLRTFAAGVCLGTGTAGIGWHQGRMRDHGATNLRDRLRSSTARQHEAVDRAFSRLDLHDPAALSDLFRALRTAIGAVRCLPGAQAAEALALRDEAIEALDADLRHLGAPRSSPLSPVELHATAVLYVLLGSRMGMGVLRRRWSTATDPVARGAGRSFGLAAQTPAWRRFCEATSGRPADGPEADAILHDAGRLFDLYLAAWPRQVALDGLPKPSQLSARNAYSDG